MTWYFVPDGTPMLPYLNAFDTKIWDVKDEPQARIGELYHRRFWRGGVPPGVVGNSGVCGSPEQWLNGASVDDPLPNYYAGTDVPTCCGPPKQQPSGGLWFGGGDFVSPCCAAGLPYVVFLHMGVSLTPVTCGPLDNAIIPMTLGHGCPDGPNFNLMYSSPTINVGGIDCIFRLWCDGTANHFYFLSIYQVSLPCLPWDSCGMYTGPFSCVNFVQFALPDGPIVIFNGGCAGAWYTPRITN